MESYNQDSLQTNVRLDKPIKVGNFTFLAGGSLAILGFAVQILFWIGIAILSLGLLIIFARFITSWWQKEDPNELEKDEYGLIKLKPYGE